MHNVNGDRSKTAKKSWKVIVRSVTLTFRWLLSPFNVFLHLFRSCACCWDSLKLFISSALSLYSITVSVFISTVMLLWCVLFVLRHCWLAANGRDWMDAFVRAGLYVRALPSLNIVTQLPNCLCTLSCHYRHVSIPVLLQAGKSPPGIFWDQPFCSVLEPWTLEIWQDIGCVD